MKIAITGCNGRVGRRVVIHCINQGHSVIGVDISEPTPIILDDIAVKKSREHEAFTFTKADLSQYDGAFRALKGCDAVVHLAAHPNPGDYVWQTHNLNVVVSWNVLRAAAEVAYKLGVTRIAQASTCNVVPGVFSKNGPNPKYFPIDEDHPCEPDEPYGLSKLIAEMQAASIVRRWPEIRIASLRLHLALPSRLLGERENPEARRNDLWGWVHVDCAAEAFLLALTVEEDRFHGHEAFFICASDIADSRSSAELHRRFFGYVPLKEGRTLEGNASFYDCRKAERLLGWKHNVLKTEKPGDIFSGDKCA